MVSDQRQMLYGPTRRARQLSEEQDFEIALEVPTPNKRETWQAEHGRVKRQRYVTRRGLEALAYRPALPCEVTLIRISTSFADSDRAALSLAAVRDELARWAHQMPEYVPGKDGKPRVPRAPDGPGDPIRWRYGQQKTKRWSRVTVKGKTKRKGFQGVRIIIKRVYG